MVQKYVQVQVTIDDVDGVSDASTRLFHLLDAEREIDLSDEHWGHLEQLLEALAIYLEASRPSTRTRSESRGSAVVRAPGDAPSERAKRRRPRNMPFGSNPSGLQLRTWAKEEMGLDRVKASGRPPKKLAEAYEAYRQWDEGPLEKLRHDVRFSSLHAEPRPPEAGPKGKTAVTTTRTGDSRKNNSEAA